MGDITLEQAEAVVARIQKENADACDAKIQAALEEFGFRMVALIELADGRSFTVPIRLIPDRKNGVAPDG